MYQRNKEKLKNIAGIGLGLVRFFSIYQTQDVSEKKIEMASKPVHYVSNLLSDDARSRYADE